MLLDFCPQFVHNPAPGQLNTISYPIEFNRLQSEVSMKCIDAVEGTVKCILKQLHSTHNQACSDDSEYIHKVKAVIDAIDQYVERNPELINDPSILKQVLYVYSRNLWLSGKEKDFPAAVDHEDNQVLDNDDYHTYYYDYLYDRGVYPS